MLEEDSCSFAQALNSNCLQNFFEKFQHRRDTVRNFLYSLYHIIWIFIKSVENHFCFKIGKEKFSEIIQLTSFTLLKRLLTKQSIEDVELIHGIKINY